MQNPEENPQIRESHVKREENINSRISPASNGLLKSSKNSDNLKRTWLQACEENYSYECCIRKMINLLQRLLEMRLSQHKCA